MKKLTLSSLLLGAALFVASGTLSLSAAEMKCGAGKCGAAMSKDAAKCGKKDGSGKGAGKCGKKDGSGKGAGKCGKGKKDGSGKGAGKCGGGKCGAN